MLVKLDPSNNLKLGFVPTEFITDFTTRQRSVRTLSRYLQNVNLQSSVKAKCFIKYNKHNIHKTYEAWEKFMAITSYH